MRFTVALIALIGYTATWFTVRKMKVGHICDMALWFNMAHICPLDYPCMHFPPCLFFFPSFRLSPLLCTHLTSSCLASCNSFPLFFYSYSSLFVLLYLSPLSVRTPPPSQWLILTRGSRSIRVLGCFNSGTWGSQEHFGKGPAYIWRHCADLIPWHGQPWKVQSAFDWCSKFEE